jgi:hypothetical protein
LANVFLSAAPSSFYEPVLPANSVNFIFCATAMHWLQHKPCEISNHVQAVGAQGKELQAFKEQGQKDWERILICRAQELVKRGKMVIINFCRNETGQYLGNTDGANIFTVFNQLWQDFVAEEIITQTEFTRMTLPQYYRTLKEHKAPFEVGGAAYQAGLRLEKIETRVVQCPYAQRFQSGEWDAPTFAKSYIPTLRSWTESTFLSGLSPRRSVIQRETIIERYYQRYQSLVSNDPNKHKMDYVHAYLVINKT